MWASIRLSFREWRAAEKTLEITHTHLFWQKKSWLSCHHACLCLATSQARPIILNLDTTREKCTFIYFNSRMTEQQQQQQQQQRLQQQIFELRKPQRIRVFFISSLFKKKRNENQNEPFPFEVLLQSSVILALPSAIGQIFYLTSHLVVLQDGN